ncbi:hypothetical protein Tco_0748923 [Tanacetum coccineum]|uniref:Uncharacterized protein n=1 Tax=Tanacetum coccineum TaxID=301880 RepID=A0ABQ4YXR4_9ASTR
MDTSEVDGDVCEDDRLIVDRWNVLNRMDESSDEEDIIEENNAANDLVADEIRGKHSFRSSGKIADMIEFNDAVNSLEVEDICSRRLKSIQADVDRNPHDASLKKVVLVLNDFVKASKDEIKILQ